MGVERRDKGSALFHTITDRSNAILLWWFLLFYVSALIFFVLVAPYMCFHSFSCVWVAEWPPIGKMAAHSAYNVFLV